MAPLSLSVLPWEKISVGMRRFLGEERLERFLDKATALGIPALDADPLEPFVEVVALRHAAGVEHPQLRRLVAAAQAGSLQSRIRRIGRGCSTGPRPPRPVAATIRAAAASRQKAQVAVSRINAAFMCLFLQRKLGSGEFGAVGCEAALRAQVLSALRKARSRGKRQRRSGGSVWRKDFARRRQSGSADKRRRPPCSRRYGSPTGRCSRRGTARLSRAALTRQAGQDVRVGEADCMAGAMGVDATRIAGTIRALGTDRQATRSARRLAPLENHAAVD